MDQSNSFFKKKTTKQNKNTLELVIVSEDEAVTITAWSMVAGRHGAGTVAESSHFETQAEE